VVAGVKFHQQHAQRARALCLGLAVQVEGLGDRHRLGGFDALAFGHLVDAPGDGLQQLAGVLKVATPQQAGAGAGQAVGTVGAQGVVGQHHTLGRRAATFAAPQG